MTMRTLAREDENVDPRHFGTSTDDTVIYLEDSMDEPTARCISTSPSVVAILSPQRLPPGGGHAVDITEYDTSNLGNGKGHRSRPLSDLTNTSTGRMLSLNKSPTPRRALSSSMSYKRASSTSSSSSSSSSVTRTPGSSSLQRQDQHQQQGHLHNHNYSNNNNNYHHHHNNNNSGGGSSSKNVSVGRYLESSPKEEQTVPRTEYEKLLCERNRYEKMYEHQKAMYEDMADTQSQTYKDLQEKIIEVVALSTRNEENKRFIRQLKREMADSKTRVMNIQNRALEETRMEKSARERYQSQLREHKEKFSTLIEQQEAKTAGLESLLNDVTSLKGESDRLQVSQLDSLLKAAYSKNTALFGDLLRQGRQIDMLFDSKATLERQLDQLRREKRDIEALWSEERRRMLEETERYTTQIAEQQQSLLELRQMLIRTLEPPPQTHRNGQKKQQNGHNKNINNNNNNNNNNNKDEDGDETDSGSSSSSYSSGSISQDGREFDEEEDADMDMDMEDEDDDDDDNFDQQNDNIIKEDKERESSVKLNLREKNTKDESSPPPLPQTERSLEYRASNLATLSAQVQARLKVLPTTRM